MTLAHYTPYTSASTKPDVDSTSPNSSRSSIFYAKSIYRLRILLLRHSSSSARVNILRSALAFEGPADGAPLNFIEPAGATEEEAEEAFERWSILHRTTDDIILSGDGGDEAA